MASHYVHCLRSSCIVTAKFASQNLENSEIEIKVIWLYMACIFCQCTKLRKALFCRIRKIARDMFNLLLTKRAYFVSSLLDTLGCKNVGTSVICKIISVRVPTLCTYAICNISSYCTICLAIRRTCF